ncbi:MULTISPECIES: ABC transporter ATP-binding protein [Brevibacillus]|jgi:ABC-type multidrug transport system, ATPase and permease components|uniref:ABC transporter ATP-binding protein n=1 Tax=Brevibacillus parabrevis TaxID=54914 RepID=A0A4Y3PB17_BREPA|nr:MULTISPECIES: ABC transporter ATP-binding protein [Brevibacillus]MDR5000551.1 ABC transporter ATP-binding protein [Brevibacillus parabrevis]MED2256489.1 ABC transporter ATP-binding protein [Brevibacillus parabrevis]NRQ52924.1 ABC transporter ATP-binding protein [Brevibacillus sp. HD1.4A]RNB96756.1 ABC transporter ATP-binding protein [Brevibacillus parabrevis]UED70482.1 ABC transporter ATP-binding protein/permease [Brevibacillus sp. HD3.3A]
MRFYQKYIKKYGFVASVSMIFLTVEALCDLLQPTIMSRIIDIGVAQRDLDYVLKTGGLMLLITALGAVAATVRNLLATYVSQNFGAQLRADLFTKVQSLSFDSLNKFDRASLVTRMTNDVNQVQVFVNGMMRIFVKAPLMCIGGLFMATQLNADLAVVLAVVVPIVGLLIFLNLKIGFPFFLKVQQALDKVNGAMREYLSGVRVVKAFNRFDFEVGKFTGANEELQKKSLSATRVMSVFSPAIMLTVNLGIVAVLWLGGLGVEQGSIQVGHIIAFTNYMTQILFSLMMISLVFNMFVRAKASAGRIGEVFAEENRMSWKEAAAGADEAGAETGRIDFENVSFSYAGTNGQPVLKQVSFTCLPGETVGIIGSTGSGKSSLVGLIPRFYDVTEGTIRVDGQDVRDVEPAKLREKMAIVPQKTTLFTGTVLENIRWGKEDATEEEAIEAARMAQAHEFIAATPEGYQTRVGQGGVNFSGGQKQRLSIARALVKKPDILILDDSTSAVDVATESRIKEALKTYAKGLTCILIAQRITSVMDADKIVVLDNGAVAGIGSHETLLATCQVYQEIFLSQIGREVS